MTIKKYFSFWRVAALLFVIAGGVVAWRTLQPLEISTISPSRGTAIEAVYATGIVEPEVSADVGNTLAGRVIEVLVNEGDIVQQGQALARMDDAQLARSLEQSRAALALAEREAGRLQTLLKRGFATKADLDRAQTTYEQARAQVALVEQQMADQQISSPLNGVVLARHVEPGQIMSANQKLFTVGAPKPLRISADVDERDMPRVQLGARVAATATAFAGQVFTASITRLRPLGDSNARTYRVQAQLPDDAPLLPGMTVDVNIILAERPNALLLPSSAIVHDKTADTAAVWLVQNGRLKQQLVAVGAEAPVTTEILGGLDERSVVALSPRREWQAGQRVRTLAPTKNNTAP